jgi:uncharacterized repeat protein (TIGR03803 family)
VFAVNPISGAEISLRSVYLGGDPEGALVAANGNLYGTSEKFGGTAFGIAQSTGKEVVFHRFASRSHGQYPYAGMVFDHGQLYGTTLYGGSPQCAAFSAGCGTVFELNAVTGHERVLYSFASATDGAFPSSRLIDVNGAGCGTVFEIEPSTGAERIIYRFHGTDGWNPDGRMVAFNGKLYGTTTYGGTLCCATALGTVFEVDPATGAQRVLHTFPSYYGDGGNPNPDLIYADGRLFGTTRFNGKNYCGSVFKINLSTNLETTIHRFPCASSTDGDTPEAGVIYLNGELYGTTNAGGINNRGTVYKISPSGAESLIYSF